MAENWTRMNAHFWMLMLSSHREKWSWILHDSSVFDRWHRWPMAQSAWSLAEGLLGGSWSKVAWFLAGYEWQLERTKTKYCTWHNETQLLWFSLFCKPFLNDMNSGKFLCPIQFVWLLQGSKIAFIWFFDAWFLFFSSAFSIHCLPTHTTGHATHCSARHGCIAQFSGNVTRHHGEMVGGFLYATSDLRYKEEEVPRSLWKDVLKSLPHGCFSGGSSIDEWWFRFTLQCWLIHYAWTDFEYAWITLIVSREKYIYSIIVMSLSTSTYIYIYTCP